MTLQEFFHRHPKAALGLSGGADSSYLLYAGIQCGASIKPYFVQTAFQPQFERRDAERLSRQAGVELTIVEADILAHDSVASNPSNRCYFCKRVIFHTLRKRADEDGYPVLIDGSNASDDADDRPGMKALRELAVMSPLRMCGMTKQDVRDRSKEAGLFTWDKPAYACLATRVPTGRSLTGELLKRVECAEDALFSMGFTDFRVRVLDDYARLQVPHSQMEAAFALRERIREALKPYFQSILLDFEARGGQNE